VGQRPAQNSDVHHTRNSSFVQLVYVVACGGRTRVSATSGDRKPMAGGRDMEFRQLGRCGLRVPVLSFGTATFGGGSEFYRAWGSTDVAEAKRLVDLCIDAGAITSAI